MNNKNDTSLSSNTSSSSSNTNGGLVGGLSHQHHSGSNHSHHLGHHHSHKSHLAHGNNNHHSHHSHSNGLLNNGGSNNGINKLFNSSSNSSNLLQSPSMNMGILNPQQSSHTTFGQNIMINGQQNHQQQNEDNYYNSLNKVQVLPTWMEVQINGMVKNISPKLWQWSHLKYLFLNDNNLMRLPPVVSNLACLQCLDISNNKIRTLPAEIGEMTSLRELYLNYNQIRVLPFELGKLFKLHQLGLKGNPLTSDVMQIYSEPNGTQKLLISLLDQLTITCPPPPRRPWMILAEPNSSQNPCIFTTMCYNVLCDKYATRQYYGYCPAWALTWDYRKKLILEDIKTLNADIICLQELETEQFHQFFLPELKQYDYDGIFSAKSRAKTMSENEKKHVDGCAIFFKTSRFQLVKDYFIEFNQIAMQTADGSEDMLNRVMTKDNIGLAALLEVKQDDMETLSSQKLNKQLLLVCTAHIHWDPEYCDVKLIQTLMFTNEIKSIIEQASREFKTPNNQNNNQVVDCSSTIPVVICADLNSLPESGVIEYLRTGRISANHTDFKELGYDLCLQKINTSERPSELSHNLKLDQAYEKDLVPYTNYTYDFKGMIDYIFFSRNLMRTVGLLGPLDIDWIKSNKIVGFPHPHVPSDHLPLMVELELINTNQNNNQNNFGSSSHYQSTSLNNNNRSNQQQQQHHSQHHSNSSNNNSINGQLGIGQMIPINSSSSNNNNSNNNFLRK